MAGNVVVYDQGAQGDVRWVRFACTGDASDGSFPTVDLAGYGVAGTVIAIQTEPGGTAPTAAYDVTVVNSAGVDILGGRALNRAASADEVVRVSGLALPRDTNTLTITGNVVPEAELKVTVIWTPAASALPVDADGAVPTHDADALATLDAIAGAVHMEDDPHVSTDSGVFLMGVRNDANASLTDTDGDYSPVRVSERGNVVIEGGIAHDEPDQGKPVKVGGVYRATAPSLADGDRGDLLLNQRGILVTTPVNQTGTVLIEGDATDGVATSGTFLRAKVSALGLVYNGSSLDRARNNVAASYLASAARTATPSSPDITTYNARGIRVSIDVTAISASPSVVPTIEVKDAVAGTYTAILTGAAIVGTGHVELVVMPGITPAANVAVAMAIARTMRVSMTHGDSDSITYSVAVELLV